MFSLEIHSGLIHTPSSDSLEELQLISIPSDVSAKPRKPNLFVATPLVTPCRSQQKSRLKQIFGHSLKLEEKLQFLDDALSLCKTNDASKHANIEDKGESFLKEYNLNCPTHTEKLHSNANADIDATAILRSEFCVKMHELNLQSSQLYSCDMCSHSYTSLLLLEKHRRVHMEPSKFSCQFCKKSFNKQSDLRTHVSIHLNLRQSICEICGKAFNHISNLIRHSRLHSGVKPYLCKICGKRFTQLTTLKEHHISLHESTRIPCPALPEICMKVFRTPAIARQHAFRMHPGVKWGNEVLSSSPYTQKTQKRRSFYCTVCGDTFSKVKDLRRHSLLHVSSKSVNEEDTKAARENLDDTLNQESNVSNDKIGEIEWDLASITRKKTYSTVKALSTTLKTDLCNNRNNIEITSLSAIKDTTQESYHKGSESDISAIIEEVSDLMYLDEVTETHKEHSYAQGNILNCVGVEDQQLQGTNSSVLSLNSNTNVELYSCMESICTPSVPSSAINTQPEEPHTNVSYSSNNKSENDFSLHSPCNTIKTIVDHTYANSSQQFEIPNRLPRKLLIDTQVNQSMSLCGNVPVQHFKAHSVLKPFLCEICGERFPKLSSLEQHLCWHSKTKSFICPAFPDSSRVFRSSFSAQLHTPSLHPGTESQNQHSSSDVGMEINGQNLVVVNHKLGEKRELSAAEGEPVCQDECKTLRGDLNSHQKTPESCVDHSYAHPLNGQEPVMSLAIKIGSMSTENPDSSKLIQLKSTTSNLRLKRVVRPYICKFCGKRFTQVSSLTRHKIIHLETERIPCPALPNTCRKVFRSLEIARRHASRLHPDVKYECLQYKISASRKQRLFHCGICGETFSKLKELRSHHIHLHQVVKIMGTKPAPAPNGLSTGDDFRQCQSTASEKKENEKPDLVESLNVVNVFQKSLMKPDKLAVGIESTNSKNLFSCMNQVTNSNITLKKPSLMNLIKINSGLKSYEPIKDNEPLESNTVTEVNTLEDVMVPTNQLRKSCTDVSYIGIIMKEKNLLNSNNMDTPVGDPHSFEETFAFTDFEVLSVNSPLNKINQDILDQCASDPNLLSLSEVTESFQDHTYAHLMRTSGFSLNPQGKLFERKQDNISAGVSSNVLLHEEPVENVNQFNGELKENIIYLSNQDQSKYQKDPAQEFTSANGVLSPFPIMESFISDYSSESGFSETCKTQVSNESQGKNTQENSKLPALSEASLEEKRCFVCSKHFEKNSNLKQHLGTHFKHLQRYKCSTCGLRFSWKSTLNKHVSAQHCDSPQKSLCDTCGKQYSSLTQVQEHVRRDHLLLRPHACHLCPKTFFKKHDLHIHIRVHTKEKPFPCTLCGWKFLHVSHLKRHQLVHNKLRRCDSCGLQFCHLSKFKAHQKNHLSNTP